jgi:hypothetical protein
MDASATFEHPLTASGMSPQHPPVHLHITNTTFQALVEQGKRAARSYSLGVEAAVRAEHGGEHRKQCVDQAARVRLHCGRGGSASLACADRRHACAFGGMVARIDCADAGALVGSAIVQRRGNSTWPYARSSPDTTAANATSATMWVEIDAATTSALLLAVTHPRRPRRRPVWH